MHVKGVHAQGCRTRLPIGVRVSLRAKVRVQEGCAESASRSSPVSGLAIIYTYTP